MAQNAVDFLNMFICVKLSSFRNEKVSFQEVHSLGPGLTERGGFTAPSNWPSTELDTPSTAAFAYFL